MAGTRAGRPCGPGGGERRVWRSSRKSTLSNGKPRTPRTCLAFINWTCVPVFIVTGRGILLCRLPASLPAFRSPPYPLPTYQSTNLQAYLLHIHSSPLLDSSSVCLPAGFLLSFLPVLFRSSSLLCFPPQLPASMYACLLAFACLHVSFLAGLPHAFLLAYLFLCMLRTSLPSFFPPASLTVCFLLSLRASLPHVCLICSLSACLFLLFVYLYIVVFPVDPNKEMYIYTRLCLVFLGLCYFLSTISSPCQLSLLHSLPPFPCKSTSHPGSLPHSQTVYLYFTSYLHYSVNLPHSLPHLPVKLPQPTNLISFPNPISLSVYRTPCSSPSLTSLSVYSYCTFFKLLCYQPSYLTSHPVILPHSQPVCLYLTPYPHFPSSQPTSPTCSSLAYFSDCDCMPARPPACLKAVLEGKPGR